MLNGPLRVRSKAKAEYSATQGLRQWPKVCWYLAESAVFMPWAKSAKRGGTANIIIRPRQKVISVIFCRGLFLFSPLQALGKCRNGGSYEYHT
ncbi:MAG: hypothetical protein EGQ91_01575 [Clostridiales bacterium]|nr:hypothetical protein [Clostridiales bacterium]